MDRNSIERKVFWQSIILIVVGVVSLLIGRVHGNAETVIVEILGILFLTGTGVIGLSAQRSYSESLSLCYLICTLLTFVYEAFCTVYFIILPLRTPVPFWYLIVGIVLHALATVLLLYTVSSSNKLRRVSN